MEEMEMKNINAHLNRIGSLRDINQAVRMISNLGGTVIAVNGLEIDYLDGDACFIANFDSMDGGRLIMKNKGGFRNERMVLHGIPALPGRNAARFYKLS